MRGNFCRGIFSMHFSMEQQQTRKRAAVGLQVGVVMLLLTKQVDCRIIIHFELLCFAFRFPVYYSVVIPTTSFSAF